MSALMMATSRNHYELLSWLFCSSVIPERTVNFVKLNAHAWRKDHRGEQLQPKESHFQEMGAEKQAVAQGSTEMAAGPRHTAARRNLFNSNHPLRTIINIWEENLAKN